MSERDDEGPNFEELIEGVYDEDDLTSTLILAPWHVSAFAPKPRFLLLHCLQFIADYDTRSIANTPIFAAKLMDLKNIFSCDFTQQNTPVV